MRNIAQTIFLLSLVILGCQPCEAAKKESKNLKKVVSLTDPKVEAASKFALQELRKLCDYCSEELRDAYQNIKISKLTSAETRPTALTAGAMYFLGVELETSKPYEGKSTDSQVLVVFANSDGTYNGMSVERSPFLSR
ncbi:hypothetical protein CYMTET_55375 [Cymbomonas tetramitiformis]|uniref:DUF3887 domain-containing protein n=1 Tax=Cymbomonas tetramitiformis TaxID=36881 RepID=A0AAE0ENN3_9CHLO|nr:hypothetical protein CYMTET_55375 [Cymbomonas tetramitiformis]